MFTVLFLITFHFVFTLQIFLGDNCNMISSLLLLLYSKLHSIYYNSLLIADHQYSTQGTKISFSPALHFNSSCYQLLFQHLRDWKTNPIVPPEDTMKIIEHTTVKPALNGPFIKQNLS